MSSESFGADDIHALPAHVIRRCHQIAVSLFHEECSGALTPVQFAALALLERNHAIDQITLAGLAALDRTTAGNVLDRLEVAGLIARRRKATDRRIKVLSITAAGSRQLRALAGSVRRVQHRLLAPLNPRERRQFMRLLTKVASENNLLSRAPLRRGRSRAR